jgi:GAF domain-containing protein
VVSLHEVVYDNSPISPSELIPANEQLRIAAVGRYEILDSPPDGAFDRITSLAARIFKVPIATITIVDHDRIWFKSKFGLEAEEIGRDPGLCASAVIEYEPWVVNDAATDPRAFENPLVRGEMGLRFYAGVPLTTADSYNLGTLNIIDRQPRELSEDDMLTLKQLADIVVDEMELRLAALRLVREAERKGVRLEASA